MIYKGFAKKIPKFDFQRQGRSRTFFVRTYQPQTLSEHLPTPTYRQEQVRSLIGKVCLKKKILHCTSSLLQLLFYFSYESFSFTHIYLLPIYIQVFNCNNAKNTLKSEKSANFVCFVRKKKIQIPGLLKPIFFVALLFNFLAHCGKVSFAFLRIFLPMLLTQAS